MLTEVIHRGADRPDEPHHEPIEIHEEDRT